MEREKISEAIEQMKVHCRLSVEGPEYEYLSVRGVLYTLGYEEDEANEVIQTIAGHGFDYCLDPMIPTKPGMGEPFMPSEDACLWGNDQLLSRLQFIS